jgi:hypothetical protein
VQGSAPEVDQYGSPNGWLAGRADLAILAPMPKVRPAIRYGIDALLILIPLLGMTYFLFDPEAFNAVLAWLARVL